MTADPWLFVVAVLSDAAATRVLIETVIGRTSGRVFRSAPVTDADPSLADYIAAPVWKALAARCVQHETVERRK